MNPFYEWLYENYANPRLSNAQLPSVYHMQSQEWQAVAEQLPQRDRLLSEDLMSTLKHDWGTISFAYGVQFGLSLAVSLSKDSNL